jgi:NAD+ synthase (glutamine-hydrolysing)
MTRPAGDHDRDFLDLRTHGFARVAVCVPPVRVADPAFNAAAHVQMLDTVHRAGAHYAVCPELGISAYTCGDLFFQDALLRGVRAGLEQLAAATADWNLLFTVGAPLAVDGLLFNCAVTLYRGRAIAVAPKSYPPNYREFYELRWFRPAADARATELALLGEAVPFGTDVLVRAPHLPGFVLHTDVCEDLWVPVPPSTLAALAGATVLANLSASNITVAKWEYRQQLVRGSSARNLAVQLYSAAGFGESTSDLAWDGHGLVAERGALIAETHRFMLSGTHVVVDADLQSLAQDRMRQTSFGDNARDHAGRAWRVVDTGPGAETRPRATWESFERRVDAHPFVPADPAERDQRCREVFLIQATSLARRLTALPPEERRVVIGISGGQDSTHALLVAAHALDLLQLGRDRLLAVTMPGLGTTTRTRQNAERLARALGAEFRELPIGELSGIVFAAIGHPPEQEDVTFENVQAWLRKILLFATASQRRGIDVGTGDLSEIALGWCTYGGDHLSHYGVNAGVPKTLITYLITWVAEVIFAGDAAVQAVLRDVLATPISPELLRPKDGEIVQRSEDVVGPYELHDFFLYHVLRFGAGPRRLARLALHAFDGRYELAEIRRWLIVFVRRFFANQFKRDAIPDGPKVGSGGALSPRGDWRMPSDASPALWLAEAEAVPEQLPG